MSDVVLFEGDCLEVLATLPDASVDAVITDPPYPEIKRDYGRWTEKQWWELIVEGVIPQVRRILKPTGSAVFVLQPNSRKLGSMRGWLWEFMAWCCREWNMVQDVWWWNYTAFPEAHAIQGKLTRPGLKACVWLGNGTCYRDQDSVLWDESQKNIALRASARCGRKQYPSGQGKDDVSISGRAAERGGVTPFNVLPIATDGLAGVHGHGAGTPLQLCRWWTRYICPPGGTILDPFAGSGTTGLAAIHEGRKAILIERKPEYCNIIRNRLAEVNGSLFAQKS